MDCAASGRPAPQPSVRARFEGADIGVGQSQPQDLVEQYAGSLGV